MNKKLMLRSIGFKRRDMAHIAEGIGTYTMRKTFGYSRYTKVTLTYIGILEEEVENKKSFMLLVREVEN